MNNLQIAFLPIARTTFDIPFAEEMTAAARAAFSDLQVDLIGPTELVTDTAGVERATQSLKESEIDLVVLFQATFADSSMAMSIAAALEAPIFLWSVPEPHTGGRLRLNSFCGINLAGHALTRGGFRYGYAFAAPDDPGAIENILIQARAGRARRILRSSHLGRVGENPDGFETCLLRPEELKERFGVEVLQLSLEEDVFEKVRGIKPGSTQPVKAELSKQVSNLDEMEPEAVHGSLSTYLTLKEIAKEKGLHGFAVRCWPEFFTELGCAACGAMSMLSDEMIPCSCEADVNGTLTQLILQSISGTQAFGTDMVSVDKENDALVIWHCGLAPLSMADPEGEKRVTIHSNRKLPLLMEFTLKPGPVTIARLSEASGDYQLIIGEGEIIRAPQSFSGTSGLIRFDKPAIDVINTILDKGLEHHISITYGEYKDELTALASMLDLPVSCIS
ncbi:MAG: L-fucose/L-arabinose isomerase family protein [Anaerolineales bacterium]|nr:L-fucose/L-arabinose isomerase family protein [Chloroflexota bacterium]MBL6983101.1 L-fucose/L-arabinose isomerase family protein [Anaerolineales bacterium]